MLEGERAQALATSARNKSQKPDGKKHVEVKKMKTKTAITKEEFEAKYWSLRRKLEAAHAKAQRQTTSQNICAYFAAMLELESFMANHTVR